MNITYKLTEAEMRKAQNELLTPINDKAIVRLITWSDQGIIFIVLLVWAFLGQLMVHPAYWVVAYCFLNLIYVMFVRPIRLRKRLPIHQAKILVTPDYDKARTICIDQNGLIFQSDGIDVHYPLRYIQDVRKLKSSLYIQAPMGFGTCIPYSAFSSSTEIDSAYALLKSQIGT